MSGYKRPTFIFCNILGVFRVLCTITNASHTESDLTWSTWPLYIPHFSCAFFLNKWVSWSMRNNYYGANDTLISHTHTVTWLTPKHQITGPTFTVDHAVNNMSVANQIMTCPILANQIITIAWKTLRNAKYGKTWDKK